MNLPDRRPAVNSASSLRKAVAVYSEIFVTIKISGIMSRKTVILTHLAEALSP
jgi:hypothetical protein